MKNLMLWLSDYQLPSYVESYLRIRNHTFKTENGFVVALLNPTNQPYTDVFVAVKTEKDEAVCYLMNGSEYVVSGKKAPHSYVTFTLKSLNPYEMAIIEV